MHGHNSPFSQTSQISTQYTHACAQIRGFSEDRLPVPERDEPRSGSLILDGRAWKVLIPALPEGSRLTPSGVWITLRRLRTSRGRQPAIPFDPAWQIDPEQVAGRLLARACPRPPARREPERIRMRRARGSSVFAVAPVFLKENPRAQAVLGQYFLVHRVKTKRKREIRRAYGARGVETSAPDPTSGIVAIPRPPESFSRPRIHKPNTTTVSFCRAVNRTPRDQRTQVDTMRDKASGHLKPLFHAGRST